MLSVIKNNAFAKLRFIQNFIVFKKFLKTIKITNDGVEQNSINKYIIVLSPWLFTSVPWFSITTGLLLQKRGHEIQFLIDDLQFENNINHKLQVNLIFKALGVLKKYSLKIEYLSNYKYDKLINNNEILEIEKLAFANAIHKNRGEDNNQYFKSLNEKNKHLLKSNYPSIKSFVEANKDQTYILSGGIYSNSGLFELLLKTNNRSYFTFDSGFEVLLSTYKGIAAQFTDIPNSLELLLTEDKVEIKNALMSANEEFEKRKNGTNKLNSQYQSFEKSENFDEVGILIPLNSPWDSAALNIASIFSGYNEWLLETIELILENSNFKITIRQHPDERHWWGRTNTDFNQLINRRFSNKRIQFVSCYDKVNSYALLMKSKAVICYSSTFGIEAAMAEKKVCVCSNVYYSKLGFSYKPSSIEDIKFFLNNIGSNKIQIDQEKARLTYYLGQQCNWLFTYFTPMNDDFKKWVQLELDLIHKDQNVSVYLDSLERFTPLSYLLHQKYHQKFPNTETIS
jgi:hypothetical protein